MDAIAQEMPGIQREPMTFSARGTWNADELCLFYQQTPGWTLSKGIFSGHKKNKTRMTFLASCNADGLEKMPLMMIGTAQNPRSLKNNQDRSLGATTTRTKKLG